MWSLSCPQNLQCLASSRLYTHTIIQNGLKMNSMMTYNRMRGKMLLCCLPDTMISLVSISAISISVFTDVTHHMACGIWSPSPTRVRLFPVMSAWWLLEQFIIHFDYQDNWFFHSVQVYDLHRMKYITSILPTILLIHWLPLVSLQYNKSRSAHLWPWTTKPDQYLRFMHHFKDK